MAENTKKITLGSGHLYCAEFEGSIPDDASLETEANRLGYIQGGAELAYTPTFYQAKDDLGYVEKTMLSEEVASFKTGIMTWNGKTLARLCSTARVTESGNQRTVKIGGADNADGKKYVLRFVHKDPEEGDTRVTIVGQNQAGFTLTFAKDKETIADAEFKALPSLDDRGTLIEYRETIDPAAMAASLAVTRTYSHVTGSSGVSSIASGSDFIETLISDAGYSLPASVTVTIGGDAAEDGLEYIYNDTTGIICVPNVTGALVITATGTSA